MDNLFGSKLKHKLLILEINEIPWRIIDKFKDDVRFSNIKKFFEGSKTYTTVITNVRKDLDEAKLVKGKTKEEIQIISNDEMIQLIGIPISHTRMKCATLGLTALKNALC